MTTFASNRDIRVDADGRFTCYILIIVHAGAAEDALNAALAEEERLAPKGCARCSRNWSGDVFSTRHELFSVYREVPG